MLTWHFILFFYSLRLPHQPFSLVSCWKGLKWDALIGLGTKSEKKNIGTKMKKDKMKGLKVHLRLYDMKKSHLHTPFCIFFLIFHFRAGKLSPLAIYILAMEIYILLTHLTIHQKHLNSHLALSTSFGSIRLLSALGPSSVAKFKSLTP